MYEYISECIKRDGYAPSVRDIQTALGIKSTSTVHSYLGKLERAGYIRREQGKSRTLRVGSEKGESAGLVNVPIIGRVTAGLPVLAEENLEGYIEFQMSGKDYRYNEYFALRVTGESMIEAGILDGDVVIVRRAQYADNGTVVVALVGDEATVKEFYREDGHFRLQPRNRTMEPIIVDEAAILGVVVASVRYYDV